MIYAFIASVVCNAVCIIWIVQRFTDEFRRLSAANFQAKDYGDAARRLTAPDKKQVKEQVDARRELGSEFSAANPFGHKKPVGL